MLKNLFKSAKQALKNPIVQLGIGALIPGSSFVTGMGSGLAKTILSNPALLQGGIGLLAGDKPENVARNIGLQALLGGIGAMGKEGPGFVEGAKSTFTSARPSSVERPFLDTQENRKLLDELSTAEQVAKAAPETFLGMPVGVAQNVLPLALTLAAGAAEDEEEIQLNPQQIENLNFERYKQQLAESQYQATGGITGFAKGGANSTNGMKEVSYGSTMGEPNGLFTGPGGPKEDKIDVMLSPGEFVMTAEATKKIGVDNLYDMMNSVDPDSEKPMEYRERVGMA
jgi:hypothetical protein